MGSAGSDVELGAHRAAAGQHWGVLQALLEAGVRMPTATALHILQTACKAQREDVALQALPAVLAGDRRMGAVQAAAAAGADTVLREALAGEGAAPDLALGDPTALCLYAALHAAAKGGHVGTVQWLLQRAGGEGMPDASAFGSAAMQGAAFCGQVMEALLLRFAGAAWLTHAAQESLYSAASIGETRAVLALLGAPAGGEDPGNTTPYLLRDDSFSAALTHAPMGRARGLGLLDALLAHERAPRNAAATALAAAAAEASLPALRHLLRVGATQAHVHLDVQGVGAAWTAACNPHHPCGSFECAVELLALLPPLQLPPAAWRGVLCAGTPGETVKAEASWRGGVLRGRARRALVLARRQRRQRWRAERFERAQTAPLELVPDA